MTVAGNPHILWSESDPPWDRLATQLSCKYSSLEFALSICSCQWLDSLLQRVSLPNSLIDLKYWPWLNVGDIPGLPNWHYDCFLEQREEHPAIHRLIFWGAGSCTEFRDYSIHEGTLYEYDHNSEHRPKPALYNGPRLLIRSSLVSGIKPINQTMIPYITKKK